MNAPLSIELEVAAKAIVDAINDLPPEARPLAKQAVLLSIDGFQESLDAVINQLPGDFGYLKVGAIKKESLKLEREVADQTNKMKQCIEENVIG